ncbi:uncharacterized protein METZ01_LOCUS135219 [marine metagenome]|uniref:Uncharacterized protein n=1 Tax=marine metagenome TaxID=408172 RepID=A0A381YZD0_9ZZZZ
MLQWLQLVGASGLVGAALPQLPQNF